MVAVLPNKEYRYSNFEGFVGEENYGARILTDFKLYAPSIDNLNDPFDNVLPYLYFMVISILATV